MSKTLARLFILVIALPTWALAADCTAPEPPGKLPDGKTAGKEAMIEGQRTVQTYVKKGDAYVACMDEAAKEIAAEARALQQNDDADESLIQEREAKVNEIIDNRNEVVSQMKRIADQFNAEIDEYQSRGSDDS